MTAAERADRGRLVSWVCALDGGEALLQYPAPLTEANERELLEWLDLVAAILKKRRDRRIPVPATPAVLPALDDSR